MLIKCFTVRVNYEPLLLAISYGTILKRIPLPPKKINYGTFPSSLAPFQSIVYLVARMNV